MFSSQSSGAVNAAINTVANAASSVTKGAVDAANDVFESVNKATNSAANVFSQNMPSFNSLIPLGNTTSSGAAKNNSGIFGNVFGSNDKANNAANKGSNNIFNSGNNKGVANNKGAVNGSNNILNTAAANTKGSWFNPLYVFAGIVVLFLAIFAIFNLQIIQGYEYLSSTIKTALGFPADPDVTSHVAPVMAVAPVTVPPEAPQDITPKEQALQQPSTTSIVERILPSSGQEVFNVAQNKFTYYDAEPLCNALGAELATYEQVKDAWGKGADWCNYGWVKGQMAVYPTQKGTYDKLQAGPVDERGACGTVGINGGFFDNPEFKYGVNCYGKKPEQSAHDQQLLMSEGKAPKSPETLKVDKMVAEFRDEADSLFVKPFSNEKWASS
jgi:hypothetical protein